MTKKVERFPYKKENINSPSSSYQIVDALGLGIIFFYGHYTFASYIFLGNGTSFNPSNL